MDYLTTEFKSMTTSPLTTMDLRQLGIVQALLYIGVIILECTPQNDQMSISDV